VSRKPTLDEEAIRAALEDPSRLEALRASGLLGTPAEPAFDRFTRLASKMLSTPVALVSLIDNERQFFKSQVGLPKSLVGRGEIPISQSFCKNLLASTEPLALADTRQTSLVAGNTTLAALGAAAYLGVPLVTAAQQILGVFCVVDSKPRTWNPDEIDVLRELAASVVTEIELRRSTNELKQSRAWLTALIDSTEDAVWAVDPSFRLTAANSRFRRLHHAMFGLDVAIGDGFGDRLPKKDQVVFRELYRRALAGERFSVERRRLIGWEQRDFVISLSPIQEDGKTVGATAFAQDGTDRVRSEAQLRQQTAFVKLLQSVAVASNQAATSSEALQICLNQVCEQTGWSIGHVYQVAPDGAALLPSDLWHIDEVEKFHRFHEITSRTQITKGEGLPGQVWASGNPAWIGGLVENQDFARGQAVREMRLQTGFAFPVLVGKEVTAVAEFYTERVAPPDQALLDVMVNLGTQLGRVVERERATAELARHAEQVRALSIVDDLTGLYNRRGFLTLAQRQLKVALRKRRRALLFFLDLDGLKQINDRLGHKAGDQALVDAADQLKRAFRDADIVGRLGGDEFVALAIEASPDSAESMSARLRERLSVRPGRGERPHALTMSIGVATFDPRKPEPIEGLLSRADADMYRVKRGRKTTLRRAKA
jgi:diguanylate cyclase (GGDEF)-like protein/PAS domain S-box-containing protein